MCRLVHHLPIKVTFAAKKVSHDSIRVRSVVAVSVRYAACRYCDQSLNPPHCRSLHYRDASLQKRWSSRDDGVLLFNTHLVY